MNTWDIEGFEDYVIDESKQVYRKPTRWRFGSCNCAKSVKKMKLNDRGKYPLRKGGIQYRLTPDEVWELRKSTEKQSKEGDK